MSVRGKHAAPDRLHRPIRRIAIAVAVVIIVPPMSFGTGFLAGSAYFGLDESMQVQRSAGASSEVSVVEFDDDEQLVGSWTGCFDIALDEETNEIVFVANGTEVRVERSHALVMREQPEEMEGEEEDR